MAKRLLDDEVIQEFFLRSRQQLIDRWIGTPPEAKEERELLHDQISALDALVDFLVDLICSGEKAEQQLAKEHERQA